jgi:hypothetical protein
VLDQAGDRLDRPARLQLLGDRGSVNGSTAVGADRRCRRLRPEHEAFVANVEPLADRR